MHERCMKKVTGEIMTASQQYSTFSLIRVKSILTF